MKWQLFILAFGTILCPVWLYGYQNPYDAQKVDRNLLAVNLYNAIATNRYQENVVISPAAIQTSMILLFTGAKGKTAGEIQTGLRLGSPHPQQVINNYLPYLVNLTIDTNMRQSTGIFVNSMLDVRNEFKMVAQRDFRNSIVERVNFQQRNRKTAADYINRAIEAQTNGKISNVIKPQQLNDTIEAVVISAASYAGNWQNLMTPTKHTFGTNHRQAIKVDMLRTINHFRFGEVRALDAKVAELPYMWPQSSMLVIVPNQANGLRDLVQRLATYNIDLMEKDLNYQKLELYLPKFKFSFSTTLEGAFRKLGVSTMFSRNGDFTNMYNSVVYHYINSIIHKSYVEVFGQGVNGPENAGGFLGAFRDSKKFAADHPFVFIIKKHGSIAFIGHVANMQPRNTRRAMRRRH